MINKILNYLHEKFISGTPKKQGDGVEHDFTEGHRYVGHDIHYKPADPEGIRLNAGGWGTGIDEGDFILLTNPSDGHTTRYQVERITYYWEPKDQWYGTLVFAPRPLEDRQ